MYQCVNSQDFNLINGHFFLWKIWLLYSQSLIISLKSNRHIKKYTDVVKISNMTDVYNFNSCKHDWISTIQNTICLTKLDLYMYNCVFLWKTYTDKYRISGRYGFVEDHERWTQVVRSNFGHQSTGGVSNSFADRSAASCWIHC